MAAEAAERNLLFGLLALQNGLIDQGQLVTAFQAWTRDKARPLADNLVVAQNRRARRSAADMLTDSATARERALQPPAHRT